MNSGFVPVLNKQTLEIDEEKQACEEEKSQKLGEGRVKVPAYETIDNGYYG